MTKTFPFFLSLAISLLICNGIITNGAHAFVLTRGTEKYHNPSSRNHQIVKTSSHRILSPLHQLSASPSDDNDKQDSSTSATNPILKAPTFNGQLILPVKVVLNGLKGHKVAAVYALQPTKQSGYSAVKYISITRDLLTDLQSLRQKYPGQMEYIRALSFSYPQKAAMQDVAQRWEAMVLQEGGKLGLDEEESQNKQERDGGVYSDEDYYDEDDDDDDDDEFEWDDPETSTTAAAADLFVDETKKTSSPQVISPFQDEEVSSTSSPSTTSSDDEKLEFSPEAVDKVLDEIRPYLISDGGNVSVHSIDQKTKSVYLTLEGACGSCPSSTVTMQMGIERILREKFDNIGTVEQVQPSSEDVSDDSSKKGLTMEAVMKEINRIGPAISAMGGMVEVLSVDELGVVEVRFRGANKVQQGLELALRDVPNVKHVKFVN
mmetsp:Transcript_12486/g.23432  ORF Transcript_12486/g.23432 Transcript_12486/m.23432 type:complete len:433 (-) Transcript_12486:43-1341(-)